MEFTEYSDQIENLINVVLFLVKKLPADSLRYREIEVLCDKFLQLIKSPNKSDDDHEQRKESFKEDGLGDVNEEETLKVERYHINVEKDNVQDKTELKEEKESKVKYHHVCPLSGCDESFSVFQDLLRHTTHDHRSTKIEQPSVIPIVPLKPPRKDLKPCRPCDVCPICDKEFLSSIKLYNHVYVDHVTEKDSDIYQKFMQDRKPEDLICSECGEIFTTQPCLSIHMREKHADSLTETYKHKCSQCGKLFMKKGTLWEHIQVVHRVEISICNQCGESYQNPTKLKNHIKQKHDQKYARNCSDCGKRFLTLRKMKAHVDQEHLGIFKHKCEICDKTFCNITILKKHLNEVHSNYKPFACEVCDFSSARLPNLNLHRFKSHQKPPLTKDEL